MKIGGAAKGKSSTYSPSWKDGHNKVKKTLKGIDREVASIQKDKGSSSSTAKRMSKTYDRQVKTQGDKIISDITGKGRKTNRQGKGNKAVRRPAECYTRGYDPFFMPKVIRLLRRRLYDGAAVMTLRGRKERLETLFNLSEREEEKEKVEEHRYLWYAERYQIFHATSRVLPRLFPP